MSTCFTAKTADGTLFYFGDLLADCSFPIPVYPAQAYSITTGGSATAAGATSITTIAVPTGVYIPPRHAVKGGWFIEFLAPGSDVPYLAELDNSAAVVGGATSIAVKALPQAIPASAVAQWPVQVRGVTTRNYNRTINTIQSGASSATGFASSTPGQQTAQVDVTIEVSDTAGYFNLRRIAGKRESAYGKLVFPQGNQNMRPETIQGQVYIGSLNRTAQDNAIQTVTTTMSFLSEPVESFGLADA
jgi:hypothetical protein